MSDRRPPRAGKPVDATPAPRATLPWTVGVIAWTLLVDLVFLAGDLLWDKPVSPLFFGDAVHFLVEARRIATGAAEGAGLPFHPPLTAWILVPLWELLPGPEAVYRASKLLMSALNAGTVAIVYRLLAPRFVWAGPFALLLPLAFGELLLGASANSEAPYRLLLAAILLLGYRAPAAGGALHGLALLTRAEHLLVLPVVAALGLRRPDRRRWAAVNLGTAVLVAAPYVVAVHGDLVAYNERFAERMAEPLPTWVPVSFYGPMNFALAQTEEDIVFSRRNLPVTQGEAAGLDPTHPVHLAYIVHGYRIGLAEIARRPGRFFARAVAKSLVSLRVFAPGWTWRDLPKGPVWIRPPVDLASSAEPLVLAIGLLFAGLGAWRLRLRPEVLAVALGLIGYRLAVNVAFFPYHRGMMVAFPAALLLIVAGWETVLRGRTGRGLLVLVAILGTFHLATGWQTRRYTLSGERDASGTIIDDRPVTLQLRGFYEDR